MAVCQTYQHCMLVHPPSGHAQLNMQAGEREPRYEDSVR